MITRLALAPVTRLPTRLKNGGVVWTWPTQGARLDCSTCRLQEQCRYHVHLWRGDYIACEKPLARELLEEDDGAIA